MSTYGTFYSGDSYICLSVSLHTSNGSVHTGDHYSFFYWIFHICCFLFSFPLFSLFIIELLILYSHSVLVSLFTLISFSLHLQIYQTRKVESHLEWDIHFWLGSTTSQVNTLLCGFQCRAESSSSKKCTILLFLYTDQHVWCVIIIVSY